MPRLGEPRPLRLERAPVAAGYRHRRDELAGLEPRPEDQDVQLAPCAVGELEASATTLASAASTTSTSGLVSVGYQSLLSRMRLQPIRYGELVGRQPLEDGIIFHDAR